MHTVVTVRVHTHMHAYRLMAITWSVRDGTTLVIRLLASSPLTSMDYLRFALLCDARLQPALARLVSEGRAALACLTKLVPKAAPLLVLLRCLVYANVLVVAPGIGARSAHGGASIVEAEAEAGRRPPAKRGRHV